MTSSVSLARRAAGSGTRLTMWLLVALAVLVGAACRKSDPAPGYQVLSEHGHELRERFNADHGTVRVVMLVSPS